MTEQAVLDRVLELTARHLGHRPEEVAADRTFVGLGADSLQLIGMVRQLEAEFGTEIGIREVLEEAGTPRLTAALIAGRAAPATTGTAGPSPAAGEPGAEAPAADAPAVGARVLAPPGTGSTAPGPGAETAAPGAPVHAAPAEVATRAEVATPAGAATPAEVATRAEVAALSEQIRRLAETQAAMITQLSEAVALLTARAGSDDR